MWKIGRVIFLKKPNKPKNCAGSFRPITLLPLIIKIFEKVLLNRLRYYDKQLSWNSDEQYGFTVGVGAEDAALKLTTVIQEGFRKREETLALFVDIKNAFNELWWVPVIKSLIDQNCPKMYISWIYDYLQNRKILHEETGEFKLLTRSTPQGACLSPFLWNIFFEQFISNIKSNGGKVIAFADDCVIYFQGRDRFQLQQNTQRVLSALEKLVHRQHDSNQCRKNKIHDFFKAPQKQRNGKLVHKKRSDRKSSKF